MDDEEIELGKSIDLFFADPCKALQPPGEFGTLYLLRRDALRCFGCKLEAIKGPLEHAIEECGGLKEGVLFPGAMVVLAGIDLLGKFLAGSEKIGGVRQRFEGFIEDYFASGTKAESHVLWIFRNTLMHSFGLWGNDGGKPVLFDLRFTGGSIVEELGTGGSAYAIDALSLHREFELSVAKYRHAVDTSKLVRANFATMFDHYGKVNFDGELLQPDALFGPYSFSEFHRFDHEMS